VIILVTGSAEHLGEALMRTFQQAGLRSIGIDLRKSAFTDTTLERSRKDRTPSSNSPNPQPLVPSL
jgi:nucleoside-diphosphate-sugar epimerase